MIRESSSEDVVLNGVAMDFAFECVSSSGKVIAELYCKVESGVLCLHMQPVMLLTGATIREMQQDFIALVKTFIAEAGIKRVMLTRSDDGGEVYDKFIAYFGFRPMVQMFISVEDAEKLTT
jgi:hypothetical protein